MRKNILLILALVLTTSVFAQLDQSKFRAGAGLVFASDINSVGITVNGVYAFTSTIEGAVGFTHVFESNYVSFNILDFDAHYVFHQKDKLNIYGLAGVAFNSVKVSTPSFGFFGSSSASSTDTGLNLGVGANYKWTDNLNLAPELRFTVSDGSFMRLGASVQYLF